MVRLDYHIVIAAWYRPLFEKLLENSLNFALSAWHPFLDFNNRRLYYYLASNSLVMVNENMAQHIRSHLCRALYHVMFWRHFCAILPKIRKLRLADEEDVAAGLDPQVLRLLHHIRSSTCDHYGYLETMETLEPC